MLKKIVALPILKSIGIYAVLGMLNALVPFLLLPILTRYLSPSDYGVLSIFQLLVAFLNVFVGVNTHGAISRQYFSEKTIDFPKYIGNCFIILICTASISFLVFFLFSKVSSSLLGFPSKWFWAPVLASSAAYICVVILTIYQVQERSLSYGIFQVSSTLISIMVSVLFIVGFGWNWQGMVLGKIIVPGLFAILGVIVLFRMNLITLQYESSYVKHALAFGAPLILDSLGNVAIAMTDRFLLVEMVGLSSAGLYVVGAQIGSIVGIIQNSFNLAWVPLFYRKLNEKNQHTNLSVVKITYIYSVLIVIIALIVGGIAPWIMSIFLGKSYLESSIFVVWIAVGYAFNGIYKMFVNYLFYTEKTKILPFVTVFLAGLNFVLSYLLISLNGPIGAAQGTMVSFFLSSVLMWFIASRVYKMPWRMKL